MNCRNFLRQTLGILSFALSAALPCLATPPNAASAAAETAAPTWQEMVELFRLRAETQRNNFNQIEDIAFFESIPDSVWLRPEFHQALVRINRELGTSLLYRIKSYPCFMQFKRAIERNPDLLTAWFPLPRPVARMAPWEQDWEVTQKLYETLQELSPRARAPYRPWMQNRILSAAAKLVSREHATPGAANGRTLRNVHAEHCPVDEISLALRTKPELLARIVRQVQPELYTVIADTTAYTARRNLPNAFARILIWSPVVEGLGPALLTRINSRPRPQNGISHGDFLSHILATDSVREFLLQHLGEIRNDGLLNDLYAFSAPSTFPSSPHRRIIEAEENKILKSVWAIQAVTLMKGVSAQAKAEELTTRLTTEILELQGKNRLSKFSDQTISELATLEGNQLLSNLVRQELNTRPALLRRLARTLPQYEYLAAATKKPTGRTRAQPQNVETFANEFLAIGHWQSPIALSDLRQIAAVANGHSILQTNIAVATLKSMPLSELPNHPEPQRVTADAAEFISAMAAAQSRLSAQGLILDPLAKALQSIENLIFQPPPAGAKGALSEPEIQININHDRMRTFGTTNVDQNDEFMGWEDRRIRTRRGIEEGPTSAGQSASSERKRQTQKQALIESDVASWSRGTRSQVLANLRAVLMRTERELNSVGEQLFQRPWQNMSDAELQRFVQSGQMQAALVIHTNNLRSLVFIQPQNPQSVDALLEAQLLTATHSANIQTARNTLNFLDTVDFLGMSSEGAWRGLQTVRSEARQLFNQAFENSYIHTHGDLPLFLQKIVERNDVGLWRRALGTAQALEAARNHAKGQIELKKVRRTRLRKRAAISGISSAVMGGYIGVLLHALNSGAHDSAHRDAEQHRQYNEDHQRRLAERLRTAPDSELTPSERAMRHGQSGLPALYQRTSRRPNNSLANSDGNSVPADPTVPRPFSGLGHSEHNVSPRRTDTMPSFDVSDNAPTLRTENLSRFHFGGHEEFTNQREIEGVRLSGGTGDYEMYVDTHEGAPTILNEDGLGMMPAPDHSELIQISVQGVASDGNTEDLQPNEYDILRTKRWGDYAIAVYDRNIAAVTYAATYRPVAHNNAGQNLVIPTQRLRPIVNMLTHVGLHPLSHALNERLNHAPEGISYDALANIISTNGDYSHRTDIQRPLRFTRIEGETNRLLRFARYRNESGRFAGTCGSYADFTTEVINTAVGRPGQPVAFVRPTILNDSDPEHLTIENELHARTGIALPEQPSFVIDSTSGTRDSPTTAPRTDPLPGGDPVSQHARYIDYRNLILYAFLGGERRRREFYEWGRQQEEIMLREGVELDAPTSSQQSGDHEADEMIRIPHQLGPQGLDGSPHNALDETAFGTSSANDRAEILRQRAEEEQLNLIRRRSGEAYEILARGAPRRRELIKRQTELRVRRSIRANTGDPAAVALHLDRSLRLFLNGDLSREDFNAAMGVNFTNENEAITPDEWRSLISRIEAASQKQLTILRRFRDELLPRFENPRTRPKHISALDRLLLENFRDPLYLETAISMFEGLHELAASITPNHLDALMARRLRLPQEHGEHWGPIGIIALRGSDPARWTETREECLTRSLEQAFNAGSN